MKGDVFHILNRGVEKRNIFLDKEDYFRFVNDTKLLGDAKIDCTIRDDQYKTDVTKRNFEEFLEEGIVFYAKGKEPGWTLWGFCFPDRLVCW